MDLIYFILFIRPQICTIYARARTHTNINEKAEVNDMIDGKRHTYLGIEPRTKWFRMICSVIEKISFLNGIRSGDCGIKRQLPLDHVGGQKNLNRTLYVSITLLICCIRCTLNYDKLDCWKVKSDVKSGER